MLETRRQLSQETGRKLGYKTSDGMCSETLRLVEVFGLVGTYAVMFSEGAAGDSILPMVVEDFRKVNTAPLVFPSSHPEIARAMEKRRLSASSAEALRDDIKYAFGGDFKALPNIVRFVSQPNRLRSP